MMFTQIIWTCYDKKSHKSRKNKKIKIIKLQYNIFLLKMAMVVFEAVTSKYLWICHAFLVPQRKFVSALFAVQISLCWDTPVCNYTVKGHGYTMGRSEKNLLGNMMRGHLEGSKLVGYCSCSCSDADQKILYHVITCYRVHNIIVA